MTVRSSGSLIARVALAIVLCTARASLDDEDENLAEKEQCLLQGQRSRSKVHTDVVDFDQAKPSTDLAWTTNMGQMHHNCSGSKFRMDYTGTHSGMVVTKGMLLKKGNCPYSTSSTKPFFTKGLSCEAKATGCHMWCAPVWQSQHDTTDWSAFDGRCKGWDGSFDKKDATCGMTGRVFTWARAEVPSSKNQLDLSFAITETCDHWCSPLWVTIYDPKNWAKSYRWCHNRKDDFGVCDNDADVSVDAWHDQSYEFSRFMQKHGYFPTEFVLELAVYSEHDAAEVMFNKIKLSYVKEVTTTEAPLMKALSMTCGSEKVCGADHQCCRKGDSEVAATCCPKDWSCCEDSCCPSYYTCNVTDAGHTCKPPTNEKPKEWALCKL